MRCRRRRLDGSSNARHRQGDVVLPFMPSASRRTRRRGDPNGRDLSPPKTHLPLRQRASRKDRYDSGGGSYCRSRLSRGYGYSTADTFHPGRIRSATETVSPASLRLPESESENVVSKESASSERRCLHPRRSHASRTRELSTCHLPIVPAPLYATRHAIVIARARRVDSF